MRSIVLVLILFACTPSIAQTDTTQTIDSAMMYLTGTFKKYNPAKAFNLFMQRANAGEAKAMNAVGLQYAKGLGVDSNFNLAVYWLTQAANNGYTKALVNLGMLYKRNNADSATYAIAFNYFSQALQQNEPSAFFAKGYMLYKGLGCTQSYSSALMLFRKGNSLDRPDCMYFTGLCYKFGYGVPANADSAGYYINKAALLGYKQANAELSFDHNTNLAIKNRASRITVPTKQYKTAEVPFIKPTTIKEFIQLDGTYKGTLIQYDYSGRSVIFQIPLTVKLKAVGNKINGEWQQGNTEPIAIEAVQNGNELHFAAKTFIATATNAKRKGEKLIFKTAQFTSTHINDSVYLKGSLQLFNTYTREVEKPMNIQLVSIEKNSPAMVKSALTIYPNPVSNSFSIGFNLKEASPVKIHIYNAQGQLVHTQIYETLQPGKQTIVIDKNLPAGGIYLLSIEGRYIHETTAFVKE